MRTPAAAATGRSCPHRMSTDPSACGPGTDVASAADCEASGEMERKLCQR